ncbi:ribonuclease H-like domain-containing protein [Fusarium redolens]|uniref:Ribonuclease H-like domain-containing protein n=1 Tax=Fusarium redolens TaxID=48865 RepID=A0A9P9FYA0_FUSRE|nr:ribonuclease H-like domain-containing protein [Fusarium redolens]KAH7213329.1 ribonuclease H-like domain-containing protein [Fusarium redolens]
MAKVDQNSKRRCKICSISFKTHSQFANHCLDADHQSDQCCEHCIRWFCSTEALAQHNKSKHGKLPEAMAFQNQRLNASTPQILQQFHFKDRNYRRFPLLDMAVIYTRLILKCHSSERLRKEGYILGQDNRENGGQADITKQTIMASCPSSLEPKRKAVALDCEMAGVRNGDSEIISICVIDFFTGQVLIKTLVKPREPIIEWRTNIHGIRPATLSIAASQGQVLYGWEAIRQELFKHINTETVIVGQSLQQDLKRLRVSHGKVFDTAILTAEAVFGADASFGRRWSLQSLCADLLKLRIRQGSNPHDALEDAMAAREVALWCICHPDKLKQWAKRARKKYNTEKAKQVERRRNNRRNVYYQAPARDDEGYYHDYGDDDDEILRWEDVVDWDTWPKSPPSSD